jgi:lambda repressor-like predicted transcriptional regulator
VELGFPKALLAEWHQACSIAKSLREKIDMILDFDAANWEATSRPAPARRRLSLSSQQLANNGSGYGSSLRELFGSLQLCSQGLNSSLSTLASHVERIIHDLITDRMVLLELQSRYVPLSSSNPLLLQHHIL